MDASSYKWFKYIHFTFNLLFMLGGAALVGIGIWTAVNFDSFSDLFNTNNVLFQYASYISIGVGCVITFLGFCGCCGAAKDSKILLAVFFGFLVVLTVVEIVILALAFAFNTEINEYIGSFALSSIKNLYGVTSVEGILAKSAWDTTQTTFKCCGYNNGYDYAGSLYGLTNVNPLKWPITCCALDAQGSSYVNVASCTNDSPFVATTSSYALTGCYSAIRDTLSRYSSVVGGVTAAVLVIQILAMIFSCCLCLNVDEYA